MCIRDRVWELEKSLQNGIGRPVVGDEATLRLGLDRSFTASTGCNDLEGSYNYLDLDVGFEVTNFASTDRDCDDRLQRQDDEVSAVIASGFFVELLGNRLILRTSPFGGDQLTYRAA